MKILLLIVPVLLLAGCATEYYPPQKGEKQGAIKRKGFVSWSDGVGKSFLNPSFNVVGK
ncbi:MAG: hypothetical protein KAS17_10250 [Victivallaceae bacterium]|nr:hypothetical protein [Victivallaceae bacterium]